MARRPVYNRHTGVLIPPPGPYSGPHILYTAHGKLPGGESWSCGLRTATHSPTLAELTTLADIAETAWHNFWTTPTPAFQNWNPSGVTYDGVTARALTNEGVTVFQVESHATSPTTGSSTLNPGGDQAALTVSLVTNLSGRHGRGRIYLPLLCPIISPTTGRLDPGMLGFIVTGCTKLLDDINTSGTTGSINPALAVQSRTSGLPAAPIVECKVGDVLDTIRGRRKKLREVYTPGAAVPPPVVGP